VKTIRAQVGTVLLALAVLLLPVTLASANGPGYALTRWTVDGGGGTLLGGAYTLNGTAGQTDAAAWSGAGYVLSGGFWHRAGPSGFDIYLPLVLRSYP
jgi:hypothetical protein